MHCENCGHKISSTSKFCKNCGNATTTSYPSQIKNNDRQSAIALAILILSLIALIGVAYFENNYTTNSNYSTEQTQTTATQVQQEAKSDAVKNSDVQTKVQPQLPAPTTPKSKTTSEIVKIWEPVTAYVLCGFSANGSFYLYQSGTGSVRHDSNGFRVVTNKHVITDARTGNGALSCSIGFPDDPNVSMSYSDNMIVDSRGLDAAVLNISQPDNYLINLANKYDTNRPWSNCSIEADRGTPLIILGYPEDGSHNSITITKGIISGNDQIIMLQTPKLTMEAQVALLLMLREIVFLECQLGPRQEA